MKKIVCPAPGCQGRRKHWCDPDTPRGCQMVEVPDDWPEGKPAYCSMTCAIASGFMTLEYVKEGTGCPKCWANGINVKHHGLYVCQEHYFPEYERAVPGTNQACGAANACTRMKKHTGEHVNHYTGERW